MSHRIYESMELGMHPASLYPRRSRVAPTWVSSNGRVRAKASPLYGPVGRRSNDSPCWTCRGCRLDLAETDPHNLNHQPPAAPVHPRTHPMAFDEQLRQAFETLTDRVREEIARELRGLTDDLVKQAAADRERAAAEAGDTARTEAERAADAR